MIPIAKDGAIRNDSIRAREVLLIDDKGEKKGVVSTREALRLANEANLDLVLVSPNARPPVAKIMDYGKFKYEKEKKEKETKKKQKKQLVKEMKFRLRIDEHDFMTKVNRIRTFINAGNKVRAVIMFLGRDIMFKDRGKDLIERIIKETADIAKVSRNIKVAGRDMDIYLEPLEEKPKKED
ncbi:translation initiation factor IF-3 [Tepiditoga spiralis]|uniref:translation initiation factor IF-3 n=1 Tax=Tepiditoga spiralis TaxID=2108365 RepID=UPI001E28844E|nr:translation initiation factor IF-3 [Tepiditoga spiralis]